MAERAAVAGAFVSADTRDSYEAPGTNAAILPTGHSAVIRRVNHLIGQVAAFDSNVLILGESGTGKEVVARAIHEASARRARSFVPINCGAIPAGLLESELFGHEKGPFTGALATRKGRFEIAEGGTIFLDEIGDMNPTMQVKLLRVLQERVFERVGSCVSKRCDVRIIAATHHNLEESIIQGRFRADLFYRLNVVPIEMPRLRDRAEGLPLLIADLPARYRPLDWSAAVDAAPEELIASVPALSVLGPALEALTRDATLSAAVDADAAEDDEPSSMDPWLADALLDEFPHEFDLRNYLESLEQRLIVRAMRTADGTVAQAARLLGLRRTTLVEKLRKYSLAGSDTTASETCR